MLNKKTVELSKYRLNKSREELETALELLPMGRFSQSINRSYYSIFHAARALLALDEVDFKKHSGVIAFFQQNYIKTGKLEKRLSPIIVSASTIRNQSDYNDFFIASKEDAQKQAENAELFLARITDYLQEFFEAGT